MSLGKQCEVCGGTNKLKQCASCLSVSYCSKEHQVADWRRHKAACKITSEKRANSLSADMTKLTVGERAPASGKVGASKCGNMVLQETTGENSECSEQTENSTEEFISPLPDTDLMNRQLPLDLPPHVSRKWMIKVANDIVGCLNQYGIAVVDKFLGDVLGDKILNEAKSMHEHDMMSDGETFKPEDPTDATTLSPEKRYRNDKVSWINGEEAHCTNMGTMMALLDNIMLSAREKLTQYRIKGRTQAMVACYPGHGACYVKHVDNPARDGRLLTCIYYLNKDWNCKVDGGMLKIYPSDSTRVASIQPLMDRLLVFWSDNRNPHEVLPSYRTRFAVTIWYFEGNEREEAKKLAAERRAELKQRKAS